MLGRAPARVPRRQQRSARLLACRASQQKSGDTEDVAHVSNPPSSLAAHKLPPELAEVENINFQASATLS